jgi:hypothetical protein
MKLPHALESLLEIFALQTLHHIICAVFVEP